MTEPECPRAGRWQDLKTDTCSLEKIYQAAKDGILRRRRNQITRRNDLIEDDVAEARTILSQMHDVDPDKLTRQQGKENYVLALRALFVLERAAGLPQSQRRGG